MPGSAPLSASTALVREALAVLGVRRLVLSLHDSAFPPSALDSGYGSPHASGEAVFAFARELGFDGLQLGPAGQISDSNVSPYDATVFARNELLLDLEALCEPSSGELLARDALIGLLEGEPSRGARVQIGRARRVTRHALALATARFVELRAQRPEHELLRAFERFKQAAGEWLELDALYEALCERSGHDDPNRFDDAVRALFARSDAAGENRKRIALMLGDAHERAMLGQFLLDRQMRATRDRARAHGLVLFGDLQIGWSLRDRFLRPELFAPGFLVGAPPSRTNPSGQPWGYPLLDPDQLDDPQSPARRAFALLLQRMFDGYDAIRIDHPHGLVCPWIYAAGDPDPARAVRQGTRAFESPDRDDATLRRWAIARSDDLDTSLPRHADRWVRTLDAAQVERYGRLVSAVLDVALTQGRDASFVAVEVLSTCPTPLRAVLERHGLGRFVVTQKANPADPDDVYRTERVREPDWVMLGTHDTPPIFELADRWREGEHARARASYLAGRLEPRPSLREGFVAELCSSSHQLVHAELADLFACAASHVLICFTDLFGEREPYNRAGVVHDDNWSLRLPRDFARVYAQRRTAGQALDLRRALALALAARGQRPDLQVKLTSA